MGLDMYLDKRRIGAKKNEKGYYNEEDQINIGYWRKANSIHNWFNQNCVEGELDNCGSYVITKGKLVELLDTCEKVLANHELAEELLPPTSGFFFGSTEIDDGYFMDLQDTVEIITNALNVDFNEWEVVYIAWW